MESRPTLSEEGNGNEKAGRCNSSSDILGDNNLLWAGWRVRWPCSHSDDTGNAYTQASTSHAHSDTPYSHT
jgi:hypothetical protein